MLILFSLLDVVSVDHKADEALRLANESNDDLKNELDRIRSELEELREMQKKRNHWNRLRLVMLVKRVRMFLCFV
jgi:vacuolar-type H+-ATPase subunit I/STV1